MALDSGRSDRESKTQVELWGLKVIIEIPATGHPEATICKWVDSWQGTFLAVTVPRGQVRLVAYTWCLLSWQMKGALMDIIQLATLDSDPWVLMVADILKSFPDTGSLNLDLEEQNPNVQDILGELREKGK